MVDQQDTPADEADVAAEQIWNEVTAERAGGDDDPAARRDDPPVDDVADADADDDADRDLPEKADSDAGTPSEEPDRDQPGADETAEEEEDDPRAALAKREADIADLRHRLMSSEGRAAAFQRKLADLQRSPAAQPKSQPAPSQDRDGRESDAAGTPAVTPEQIAALRDEYEDLAPVLDLLTDLQARQARDDERHQQAEEQRFSAEWGKLVGEHGAEPMQVIAQNRDAFNAWLDTQPIYVWRAVEANQQRVVDGDAAAQIITDFKAHLASARPDGGSDPDTRKDHRRKSQLSGASGAPPRGRRPAMSGIPKEGDAEEIWDAITREKRRD